MISYEKNLKNLLDMSLTSRTIFTVAATVAHFAVLLRDM